MMQTPAFLMYDAMKKVKAAPHLSQTQRPPVNQTVTCYLFSLIFDHLIMPRSVPLLICLLRHVLAITLNASFILSQIKVNCEYSPVVLWSNTLTLGSQFVPYALLVARSTHTYMSMRSTQYLFLLTISYFSTDCW